MFKTYNQDQNFLLPPSFSEFLWEDHEAVILNEIIEDINLLSLYSSYKNIFKWTSAFDPSMLLKILFYWYMNQIFSSRRIASKLKSDIAFMYLAWNNKPDFRTINRFRKDKWIILEDIFVQIVIKARELWLISFWVVSLDWTKIYANASKENNINLSNLEKTISDLFKEAEYIDSLEDEEFKDDDWSDIPSELKTKEERDKKRKEIENKKKDLEDLKEELQKRIDTSKKVIKDWKKAREKALISMKINTIDKDSRLMQMKKKDFANWYNTQILSENQIILSSDISWSPSDINELLPVLKKFKKQYNNKPEKLLADKWYSSTENYEYLENENIDSYIPIFYEQVKLNDYTYNKDIDTYTDKNWNIFTFKEYSESKIKSSRWRPKKWLTDRSDNFKLKIYQCKNHSEWKKILKIRWEWHKHVLKQKEKFKTDYWKKLYSKRQTDVETVFANIKNNLNFKKFQLRWLSWVNIEWNLIAIAHNLKKIIKYQLS